METLRREKELDKLASNVSSASPINNMLKSTEDTLFNDNSSENRIMIIELDKGSHINQGHDISEEQFDQLRRDAAKHSGHENQHLAMILVLVSVTMVSQILLVLWKSKYCKSYIHTSMIAMYTIPFGISLYRHWWRFVSIWVIISLITIFLVWTPLMKPNFARSGSTIPRLLYRWFFALYSLSSIFAGVGYFILLLTFFGINIILSIPPQISLDIGFMMLFYGIYYGVLCRDFTDFLVDRLAAQIGYYNPTSALPSKSLKGNICAICGMEHGNKEDIDMDTLSKSNPLLTADGNPYMDGNLQDEQPLVEYEESNMKERLFVLSCGHKFHEFCIYGWCLVGKRQVCPFCKEKVDLGKLFSALPFQKPHYLYGNLLDFIRYLFAWQPLIFLAVHFLDYELGLE